MEGLDPKVWASKGNPGWVDILPVKIQLQPGAPIIWVTQYPLEQEARKGLISAIQSGFIPQHGLIDNIRKTVNIIYYAKQSTYQT